MSFIPSKYQRKSEKASYTAGYRAAYRGTEKQTELRHKDLQPIYEEGYRHGLFDVQRRAKGLPVSEHEAEQV